jgi:hypothetical protein
MSTNTANSSAERRLKNLGTNLPRPPTPLGAYVEAVRAGNLLSEAVRLSRATLFNGSSIPVTARFSDGRLTG